MSSGLNQLFEARCLSDFRIDQTIARELGANEEQAVRAHLADCPSCADRFRAIESTRVEFAQFPSPVFVAQRPRRRLLTQMAGTTLLGIAAAVAVVVTLRLGPPDTRTKGAAGVSFFVKHGESVRLGAPGEVVAPGDTLQFAYSSDRDQFLAILSLDGQYRATVYYPTDPTGDRAALIRAGREIFLGQSTRLDGVLGHEQIVALFCQEPVALEPLRVAFETGTGAFATPAGCKKVTLSIEKRTD